MFSKLVMTILVALVGLSVVAASPVNAAAPSCPPSNNQPHDPFEDIIPTRPLCCTAHQTPPFVYYCSPYQGGDCPLDKPVIRCCYGGDPYHPFYHCSDPN